MRAMSKNEGDMLYNFPTSELQTRFCLLIICIHASKMAWLDWWNVKFEEKWNFSWKFVFLKLFIIIFHSWIIQWMMMYMHASLDCKSFLYIPNKMISQTLSFKLAVFLSGSLKGVVLLILYCVALIFYGEEK